MLLLESGECSFILFDDDDPITFESEKGAEKIHRKKVKKKEGGEKIHCKKVKKKREDRKNKSNTVKEKGKG